MTPPAEHFDPDDMAHADLPEMQVEERRASVVLRRDDAREARVASMAAAHRSLADALRLIHRLILIMMFGLVLLFFLSGFRQINETERGVRLLFGRAVSSELAPGFRFSWPRPMGDIRKVDVSQQTVLIHEAFYPDVPKNTTIKSVRDLGIGAYMLDPKVAGSVITGDGSLAHLRLNVDYQIENPVAYLEAIGDEQTAKEIVSSVAQQAAVRVVAEMSIDELLRRRGSAPPPEVVPTTPPGTEPTPDAGTDAQGEATDDATPAPEAPVSEVTPPIDAAPSAPAGEVDIEVRMRELAQASLDSMESGIRVARIAIFEAAPPARLTADFDRVQKARYEAALTIDRARGVYNKRLNAAGGAASEAMLALIDLYGRQLDADQDGAAAETSARIFALMRSDGGGAPVEPIVVNGVEYGRVRLSGEAAKLISEAEEYRFSARKQAEELASTFRAKLSQYRANPEVFVAREWSEAMRIFAGHPYVDAFMMPDGTDDLSLLLNTDPDIAKAIQRENQRRRLETNLEYRSAEEAGELVRSDRNED